MGNVNFNVVPEHMDADAAQWSSAAESLGKAVAAVKPLAIKFGRFDFSVGETYAPADRAARQSIVTGERRLGAVEQNIRDNYTSTKSDDDDSDSRVRKAASSGAGGDGGGGGAHGEGNGGKGGGHYAELMGGKPMPTDPKDPDITFDRKVDPETGEVSWTPREMKPGEASALDGRDVERIPSRADRIVVTMVDGEPQITYVDTDGHAPGSAGHEAGAQWEASTGTAPETRVVAGSGAQEPQAQLEPITEWSRTLPAGADFAVVEMRDGEPHLVFLDVEGRDVTEIRDVALTQLAGHTPTDSSATAAAPALPKEALR